MATRTELPRTLFQCLHTASLAPANAHWTWTTARWLFKFLPDPGRKRPGTPDILRKIVIWAGIGPQPLIFLEPPGGTGEGQEQNIKVSNLHKGTCNKACLKQATSLMLRIVQRPNRQEFVCNF